MTEHSPIQPPSDDRPDDDGHDERDSLLERASGAFGLHNLGAAPMPGSFDDVPMKRARPLRRKDEPVPEPARPTARDPGTPTGDVAPAGTDAPEAEAKLPVPTHASTALPATIDAPANAVTLQGERISVDTSRLRERGFIDPSGKSGALAEEFRIVKRQILEAARGRNSRIARRILVTSPHEDEGKTFCAVNLALSLAAESDLEIVLVDADIGNPSIAELFGVPAGAGLMDTLGDEGLPVERTVVGTDIGGLWLLPPGRQTANTSEALSSRRTAEMFERLTAEAPNRIVLIDSPPALAASPAAELAKHSGQTILVARADRTAKTALEDAAQLLSACPDIKLVLNGANFSPSGRRFGSYYE